MELINKNYRPFIRHLRFEALALAILMIVLTYNSEYSLWVLPASFLFFDIGALGYLFNQKIGALTYNIMHNYTIPTLLIAVGLFFDLSLVSVIGYCWSFHIAVDRLLGFGLKHKTSFHHTHMGNIKKN